MLQRPESCIGCALNDKATGFSQPEGHGSIGVLMFGEALGESEARDGLPFRPYAQAGSLLERVIKISGFDRQQFRIFNMVNCRPPRDYL
jgi:uracil-DNA glycosylase